MNQKPKKRKISRKFKNIIIRSSLVLCIGFFGFEIYEKVSLNQELKQDLKQTEEILKNLDEQKADLTNELAQLEDPDYVKYYARGKYMVTKDGEQIFILPSSEE